MRQSIAGKLLISTIIMAITVLLVGAAGAWVTVTLMQGSKEVVKAAEAARLSQRVNMLVLAAVMDSRGIYMSATSEQAEKFTVPLLANLRSIEKTTSNWEGTLSAAERPAFLLWKAEIEKFVALRREMVRLSRDVGPADARAFGDNDAARAIRQKLNDSLTEITTDHLAMVKRTVDDLDHISRIAFIVLGVTCCVGSLIGIVTSIQFSKRAVIRPVRGITAAMQALAADDLSVSIPWTERGDEIGKMAAALAVFKQSAVDKRRLTAEQEEHKRHAADERRLALRTMADTFEGGVGHVVQAVTTAATQLQAAAGQMSGTAQQTSTQATAVAVSAHQASANVQTVAAASEQLTASINEIARQMSRSQAVTDRATEEAGATTQMVHDLSDSVSKIGEIVGLINDIASQTNLLALNARIESARAGEAGKGFAVVAHEVKHLAGQTAKATEDIASQIATVQKRTLDAVTAINTISQVIAEMGEISASVASAVQQQTAATGEIARNVEQAARGAAAVSATIRSVEEAARETGQAAAGIGESSRQLSGQAAYLSQEVSRFLDQVRADNDQRTLVEWSDHLACGVANIDQHHKAIFEQLNLFYRKMMDGEGADGAAEMLFILSQSIRRHFDEEEGLMVKADYPALAPHRQSHLAFLDRLATLTAALNAQQPDAVGAFFDLASSWLIGHIQSEDGALATFLRAKPAVG